jgi:RNA polymerase primary sigma factor
LVIAAECGDSDACRRLVEAFIPAIASLARSFQSAGIGRQELLQEGVASLLFAARRYDVALQTPFWAYASFWVRKGMQELVAELKGPMALSDRAVRELARVAHARRDHLLTHGREPSSAELSVATGLTHEQLARLETAGRPPRSTQETTSDDADSGSTLGDTIVDHEAERAYQQVVDDLEILHVRDLTAQLDERERHVIQAHYGLGRPGRTLSDIGAELGLTAERVRQIEVAALARLRAILSEPAAAGGSA